MPRTEPIRPLTCLSWSVIAIDAWSYFYACLHCSLPYGKRPDVAISLSDLNQGVTNGRRHSTLWITSYARFVIN